MISRIFPCVNVVDTLQNITVINEHSLFTYTPLTNYATNVLLNGYFQNENYFPSSKLIPSIKTSYYPNTYFIHIRAGDYLKSAVFNHDLSVYYENCINTLGPSVKYIVFSNDNEYAKRYMANFNVQYTLSDKTDQVEVLIEMANCEGGICANSSFSWLGAFFQDKTLGKRFMPSVWMNGTDCSGLYPRWATVISISSRDNLIINKPIILKWITMINYGYIEFTKNFLESMRVNNCVFSLIIYCLDKQSFDELKDYNNVICIDASIIIQNLITSSLSKWGQTDYKIITFYKLDIIRHAIENNINSTIGFIDTDIIVLKDPTKTVIDYINNNLNVEVFTQCDENKNVNDCSNIYNCPVLCSGVCIFRNNSRLFDLLNYHDRNISKYNTDQDYLLDICNKNNIKRISFSKNIFLNGSYAGVNNNTPLILPSSAELIHYNHIIGEDKIACMKKNKMWYLEKNNQAIIIKSHNAGMGSLFNSLILQINEIKTKYPNTFPVVMWDTTNYGEGNIFNKYFSIKGFNSSINYTVKNTVSGMCFSENIPRYRSILHALYKEHIVVNPIITDKVNSIFMNSNFDYLIGVHFRNTDRAIEPQYASPGIDKVSKSVVDVLKKNTGKKLAIYIASDNNPDVIYFKKYLKESYEGFNGIDLIEDPDNVRSDNQISVHGTHDKGNNTFTPEQKALSILVDIYALAKCNILVRTCSNVTCSSGIINKDSIIIDVSLEYGKFTEKWLSETI
jgi:hypothetical protein